MLGICQKLRIFHLYKKEPTHYFLMKEYSRLLSHNLCPRLSLYKLISHSGFFRAYAWSWREKHLYKKEKETRWFSRKFCVCEARKGPNPTPFIADDSWPLFVLSVRGNPKWGTSRDQWNSALNYLIYWSSSKTLKTICASEAPKLLAPIYAQNKNTTILSQEKLPHLYPVLSTKYYRLFQMSAVLISKEKHGVWKFQKSLI